MCYFSFTFRAWWGVLVCGPLDPPYAKRTNCPLPNRPTGARALQATFSRKPNLSALGRQSFRNPTFRRITRKPTREMHRCTDFAFGLKLTPIRAQSTDGCEPESTAMRHGRPTRRRLDSELSPPPTRSRTGSQLVGNTDLAESGTKAVFAPLVRAWASECDTCLRRGHARIDRALQVLVPEIASDTQPAPGGQP